MGFFVASGQAEDFQGLWGLGLRVSGFRLQSHTGTFDVASMRGAYAGWCLGFLLFQKAVSFGQSWPV